MHESCCASLIRVCVCVPVRLSALSVLFHPWHRVWLTLVVDCGTRGISGCLSDSENQNQPTDVEGKLSTCLRLSLLIMDEKLGIIPEASLLLAAHSPQSGLLASPVSSTSRAVNPNQD